MNIYQQVVYEAFDGRVFMAYEECVRYEHNQKTSAARRALVDIVKRDEDAMCLNAYMELLVKYKDEVIQILHEVD
jgi:hypothetical protein